MRKNKVLIIGSKDSGMKNNAYIFSELLQSQNACIDVANWEDLLITITARRQCISYSGVDVAKDYSLVIALNWYKSGKLSIYRDVAYALAIYLQYKGVKFWNSEMLHQRSTTKLSMMMQLATIGVDVPETIYSLNPKILRDVATDTFPCIVKAVAASRGESNYLVHNKVELWDCLKQSELNRFIIQEYIPNEADIRLVCANGEAVLAIERRRTSVNTHLNNTSQGADAVIIELNKLPKEILTKTKKICKITGRELAGVDWMFATDGSNRFVCLEVNAIPQITSGTNVDTKINKIGEKIQQILAENML